MTETTQREQSLMMNLNDAGCDDALIQQCMELLKSKQKEAVISLLSKHRRYLLDCYHADQKKISCLDFFLYQLNQQERRK